MKISLITAFVFLTFRFAAEASIEEPKPPVVKLTTNAGEMLLELFPEDAPKHVESFLNLIEKGFYNDLTFHRVVPEFVIQGGCPIGDGTGDPGYKLEAEFNSNRHEKGTLAMARSSHPDSAGSQFYICLARCASLDGNYTVFGQVVQGLDVPEKVKQGDKMRMEILKK